MYQITQADARQFAAQLAAKIAAGAPPELKQAAAHPQFATLLMGAVLGGMGAAASFQAQGYDLSALQQHEALFGLAPDLTGPVRN